MKTPTLHRVCAARRGATRRRQSGLSLLELMLAVALGLAMTAAVVQLFAGSGRSQAALGAQARLQESARHALTFLSRSARGAGYLGCRGRAGAVRNALHGDWTDLPELNIPQLVEAFDATGGGNDEGDWRPSLRALPIRQGGAAAFKPRHRIDLRRLRPGSDIVVFRRTDAGAPLAAPLLSNSDPVVAFTDAETFRQDDFALVSSCAQSALFRVTSTATANSRATLARSTGSSAFANRAGHALLAPGSTAGGSTGPQGSAVALVVTEMYFVARSAAARRGAERWALWRKTSTAPPRELVAGVEDLQLLLGVDATDDGIDGVERYVVGPAVGGNAVRALHITATLSDAEGNQPRAFTKTVALRN